MASTQTQKTNNVAQLQEETSYVVGESLWMDAWRRLIRNRAAMLGVFIIIAFILAAIFADYITPQHFAVQELEETNATPMWLMTIFPSMTPKSSEYRIGRGWEALVETGDQVEADQLLMEKANGTQRTANADGTIFIDSRMVVLVPFEVDRVEIPSGWTVQVSQDAPITKDDILLANADGTEVIKAQRDGIAYVTEELVLVRPTVEGYVPVSEKYPIGADNLGRDLFSRIVYGARVSLLVAFVGPLVSLVIGVPFGLIAGYSGGRVDNIMMRMVDTMYAFPTLLLIILLMAFFRSSFGGGSADTGSFTAIISNFDRQSGGMLFIFIGVGITSWMGLARLTRGQVLSLRETEFVLAANSIGARTSHILSRHVLPNILGPIIIAETLTIPIYISYEAFLSFIGLGVNPPTPSWGGMISEGGTLLRSYPHQALLPALALFMIMFAFNFLGDGLRDALDPRMRGVD
jgi:oligopeptide transport system permease protein